MVSKVSKVIVRMDTRDEARFGKGKERKWKGEEGERGEGVSEEEGCLVGS